MSYHEFDGRLYEKVRVSEFPRGKDGRTCDVLVDLSEQLITISEHVPLDDEEIRVREAMDQATAVNGLHFVRVEKMASP